MRIPIPASRPAITASGLLYSLGRLDYAYMTQEERDAHQSAYRAFLLALLGPAVFTYTLRGGNRSLLLRMRADEGNRQALSAIGAPWELEGEDTPGWLRAVISSPGMPHISSPTASQRLRPMPPKEALPRTLPRERLRLLEGGTGFRQVLSIESFPQMVDELCLERLWRRQEDLIFTLRMTPLAPGEAQRVVERRLIGLQASASARSQRGAQPEAEVEQARADALSMRSALVEGRERLFSASLLASVEGQSRLACEESAARLREIFAEAGFGLHVLLGGQREGARWLLPEFAPREPPGRLLSANSLSCLSLLPAAPPPPAGRRVGRHLHDGTEVLRPRETLPNPLELVLGSPGHGKSVQGKTELLRAEPRHLVVVDPEGEYGPLVRHLGGGDMVPERGGAPEPSFVQELHRRIISGPSVACNLRGCSGEDLPATLLDIARAALLAADELAGRAPLWLTVDEAHLWLSSPATAKTLLDLAKRARKRGLVLTLISQNVGDFLQSEQGQMILSNAGRLLLFRQQATDGAKLAETLRLSARAADFIRRAPPGEALLVDDHGPVPIRVDLSEEELRLVDTRPAFARPS